MLLEVQDKDNERLRYAEMGNDVEFDLDGYFDYESTQQRFGKNNTNPLGDFDEFGTERFDPELVN